MVWNNSRLLFLTQLVLSFTGYISCQSEPNATIYVPGISIIEGQLGTAVAPLVVSQVTVQGDTTIFQLVDTVPTEIAPEPLTATLKLSPSAADLTAENIADGIGGSDISCSISNGESSCQISAALVADGATIAFATSFTEPTAGVPVVAIGVSIAASGSQSGSASGSNTSGSNSASETGASNSQTGASSPAVTSSPTVSGGNSSSSPSSTTPSGSNTTPAVTNAPSSAMGLQSSMGTILIGFCLVLANL